MLPDSASSALVQPLRPLLEGAFSADAGLKPGGGGPHSSSTMGEGQAKTDSSGNGSSADASPAAGVLVLWSDKPRALSQRERMWAAAVAAKLCDTLA